MVPLLDGHAQVRLESGPRRSWFVWVSAVHSPSATRSTSTETSAFSRKVGGAWATILWISWRRVCCARVKQGGGGEPPILNSTSTHMQISASDLLHFLFFGFFGRGGGGGALFSETSDSREFTLADAHPAAASSAAPTQIASVPTRTRLCNYWRVEGTGEARPCKESPRTSEIRRFSPTWKLPGADAAEPGAAEICPK